MRELGSIRSWSAVVVTLALGVVTRQQVLSRRRRLKPRVTPMRLIHPDELAGTGTGDRIAS